MVEVIWTKQSASDLKNIFLFIARDSEKFARIQIEELISGTDILLQHPFSGKKVREMDLANVREIVSGNYRIFYRIKSDKRIFILTVHHAARLLKRKL